VLAATVALMLSAAPAADPGPSLHPDDAQKIALADAERLGPEVACKMRYFRVRTPRGPLRTEFLVQFFAHLNKLSTRKHLAFPQFVTQDVIRIDVEDYNWHLRGEKELNVLLVWEKTAALDPWFHQVATVEEEAKLPFAWPGGFRKGKHVEAGFYKLSVTKGDKVPVAAEWVDRKRDEALRRLTLTESPILDAEWFEVQTKRQRSLDANDEPGIGYYDFLALKDRDAMLKLVGTSFEDARRENVVWKGAVLESNVGIHNRLLFRLGARSGGGIWGTFDTDSTRGRGDLLNNLKDGEFKHVAEEYMFFLANMLDGNFLCTDKGVRQAVAPDKAIGADDSKLALEGRKKYRHRDTPIHANLSCMGCHGPTDLLMDFTDDVRKAFKQGGPLLLTELFKKKLDPQLQDDYLTDMDYELKADRLRYVNAVKRATTVKGLNPDGWTVGELSSAYRRHFDRNAYERLTLSAAARELGLDKKRLKEGIKAHASEKGRGQTDAYIGRWLDNESETMARVSFEERIALLMLLGRGKAPVEKIEEKK
jgi:hypothetical protein